MSYDIYLNDPVSKETIQFDEPHHMRGGTYRIGGTTEAHINVTYNYSKFFSEHLDSEKGIRVLYGMSGAESIPVLENAISRLGNDVDEDYWRPTEGNAKRALIQLLTLAKIRPDGIWDGD